MHLFAQQTKSNWRWDAVSLTAQSSIIWIMFELIQWFANDSVFLCCVCLSQSSFLCEHHIFNPRMNAINASSHSTSDSILLMNCSLYLYQNVNHHSAETFIIKKWIKCTDAIENNWFVTRNKRTAATAEKKYRINNFNSVATHEMVIYCRLI